MGFVYHKPLSLEQIFSYFNNDNKNVGGQELSQNNNSIFGNFAFTKDMTLEQFEKANYEVYQKYEEYMAEGWAKQKQQYDITPEEKEETENILNEIRQHQQERLEQLVESELQKSHVFGVDNNSPQPKKPNRMSYAEALSLVKQIGDTVKDGGSKSCSIDTPEGTVHIFLDNAITSKTKGHLSIMYPDGTIDIYDANGQPVRNKQKENDPFNENHPEEFYPLFKPDMHPFLGSDSSTPPEEVLMKNKLLKKDEE